ncbi:hypothetical protein Pint_13261 [Pistacia integerrima]|uniref:Uncharacterized protein n=1 Tax=Pistacia integerrima TaxID=434235 RepID=A0ACC0YBL7_9ROSI|nr:hypothetical protein Pint_13261 [Pistacia integerrima]
MSNLVKLQYKALRLDGKNYDEWALDTTLHLESMKLGEVIKEGNITSLQDKSKAIIFLRHHIQEGLRAEYKDIKDPLQLWTNLKERERNFKKYSELISCLLVAEQNNELLLRNHQTRPIGSQLFPVEHDVVIIVGEGGWGTRPGSQCSHEVSIATSSNNRGGHNKTFQSPHQKWSKTKSKNERSHPQNKNNENKCYICAGNGH